MLTSAEKQGDQARDGEQRSYLGIIGQGQMNKSTITRATVFIISFAFFFGLSSSWNRIAALLRHHGLPAPLIGLLGLLVVGGVFLFFSKQVLLGSSPKTISIVKTDINEYHWLDHQKLAMLSRAFEAIGFGWVADYTIQGPTGMVGRAFARGFYNSESNCFAEINAFESASWVGMECNLISQFDDGWSLSTTTRRPRFGSWILRKRRSLWSAHVGASPGQLQQIHLAWRENITHHVGVQPLQDFSFENYAKSQEELHLRNKQLIRRRSMVLIFWDQISFTLSPKMEWKGEFAKFEKKRA